MNSEVITHRPGEGNSAHRSSKWSGLQARMTLSYVWVTIGLVLIFMALAWLTFVVLATNVVAPFVYTLSARNLAERYAFAATLQADTSGLNPRATFLPDQPGSLALPGTSSSSDGMQITYTTILQPDTQRLAFALLIAPDSHVLASSYPKRYPATMSIALVLPERTRLITNALAGTEASGNDSKGFYAVEPVWSRERQPIGAIYVQLPGSPSVLDLLGQQNWLSVAPSLLMVGVILLVLITPIGGLFGLLTTRGLIRRIRALVSATTQFADGHYSERVSVGRKDEIGQLEQHFNRMAEQLAAGVEQQQALAGRNARLEERARISRELHDAISQDLFSLRMLGGGLRTAMTTGADLQPYVDTLEEATTRMIREMRALLLELRPGQLESRGLAAALEELASAYSLRLGINVTASVEVVSLDAKTEHALLRIAQEALTNAVRHGDASTVTLRLQSVQENIEFEIIDDGKGFDAAENKRQHGLGLRLMQERAQELHGAFSLKAAPGQGTRIHILLPQEKTHD